MQPYVNFVGSDYSGESCNLSLYFPPVTGANYAAMQTLVTNLLDALATITLCGWRGYDFVPVVHTDIASLPASPYAQRERRAIFDCVDTVSGRPFVIGVPCPDMTDMAIAGTDAVNMTDTEVAAYRTVVMTYARSPEANNLNIVSGKVIGVRS